MTVVGISMVRDEADIVARTVAHMAEECDHVIVADNGSVDGTREILEALGVEVVDDPERGYWQSQKMTALAHRAREEHGATWVVPFDADEWWSHPAGRIADVLADTAPTWGIVSAQLFDHVATGADPDDDDPVARIGWRRRDPGVLPKVACRAESDLVIEQGNHAATYAAHAPQIPGLQIRHYPYRSAAQFVRKALNGAEAYAATDLPEDVGRHWREYGRLAEAHGPEALEGVFRRWFRVADPESDESLIFDPVA